MTTRASAIKVCRRLVKRFRITDAELAPVPAAPRVTQCPGYTHDPRYQLAPDERVVAGFETAGIGHYLDTNR